MIYEPLVVHAPDGAELGVRVYPPNAASVVIAEPLGTVIIHGATAVPQTYYAKFASYLAGRGLRVVTYDYRGIGASRPNSLRKFDATMSDWATDARAVWTWATKLYGPLAFIGHSFGGQLIGLADELASARGALLVGAQFGYYGHWSLPSRVKLGIMWRALVPAATSVWGYLPGELGLTHDLPAGVALEWAKWCRHPDYLMGHEPAARARLARFDVPTLFYSFADDDFAPRGAVRSLLASLTRAPLEHRRLRPSDLGAHAVGHFGFFREAFESTLWNDAATYLTSVFDDATRPRFAPHREDEALFDFLYHRDERAPLYYAEGSGSP